MLLKNSGVLKTCTESGTPLRYSWIRSTTPVSPSHIQLSELPQSNEIPVLKACDPVTYDTAEDRP